MKVFAPLATFWAGLCAIVDAFFGNEYERSFERATAPAEEAAPPIPRTATGAPKGKRSRKKSAAKKLARKKKATAKKSSVKKTSKR